MIVKLSARSLLCRAWPSPSTSVEVHYRLSHQPQTDEQKQQNAPTPASNSRIPAAKALPRRPHKAECQQQRRSHVGLKRPNTSSKGAPTPASNDRIPAAKIMIFTKRHNKMPKKPPPEEKEKPASVCALAGFSYDKTCLVLVY